MASPHGYQLSEFIEFAQLFLDDGETIRFDDEPAAISSGQGTWVNGWFHVTERMVDRYRMVQEESATPDDDSDFANIKAKVDPWQDGDKRRTECGSHGK
jgi:hypothetical protein